MMLFEIRRAAKALAAVLRVDPQWATAEPDDEPAATSHDHLRPVTHADWAEHQPEHARVAEHSSWADSRGSLPPPAAATASTDASIWG
jgi:hypothetical protein